MNLKTKNMASSFRRRSLKVTANAPEEIPQNDDEAERQQRRRDSGKFTQLAEQRLSVGAGSSSSTGGTSFVEFSATELVAQYENCIKLSFANKINHKNAFSLPLIDCMKTLLKKKDAQMNNFQFVSCTLDASAKIYASRVDRVHMDGLNFAQNLGVQPRGATARPGDDGGDAEEEADPKSGKPKKKYKRKRRNIDDTSKITMSLTQQVEQDATYTFMRKQFSNCQPGFTSFVPRLAVKGDGCRVLLDLREPLLAAAAAPAPTEGEDEWVDVPVDLSADLSTKSLCPTYQDILNCEAADIDYNALLQPTQTLEESLAMDMDLDEPADFEAGGDDFPCEDIDEDMTVGGGFSETMATSLVSGAVATAHGPAGDMRERVVDVGPSSAMSAAMQSVVDGTSEGLNIDYTTQRLERMLWAGPAHWRQLPLCKARAVPQAEAGRRKDRRAATIDFLGDLQDIEMVSSKRTTLSAAFMKQNWSVQKVTNPPDLHLDPKVLTRLFLRPEVEVFSWNTSGKQTENIKKKAGRNDVEESSDHGVCQYDYDNLNDSQSFCPDVHQESFDGSDENDGGAGEMAENQADIPAGDVHAMESQLDKDGEWQLVAPPQKVPRININFAQHAKRVDMKKLKKLIWETLIQEGEAQSPGLKNGNVVDEDNGGLPDDPTTQEVKMMKGRVQFSRLYQQVLNKAPKDMAPDLTVHLVFTAQLHLANEKILILEGNEDFSDFAISQHQSAALIVHKHGKRQYK